MEKKKEKLAKDTLTFEKTTIVSLNNQDMSKIKGGGFPNLEYDGGNPSDTRGCGDQIPIPSTI